MVRRASVYVKVSGSCITAVALVALLMALASCLAGTSGAASPDRLYATGFNGSYLPPGYSVNVSPGDFLGNAGLFIIDPADGRLISSVPMNEASYYLAISPSGTRLYSTNGYSRNITVVDLTRLEVLTKVPLNSSPCSIALSPDGAWIYAALPDEKAIVMLDSSTYATHGFIPLDVAPYSLAVSSDGLKLFAASSLNGTLSVIDIADNQRLSTVSVGIGLADVIVRDNTVYVADSKDNVVYAVDAAGNVVKSAIKGITAPSCLAFDIAKNSLIVTSLSDKNITRVDAASYNISVTRSFWSSKYGGPAISSDGSLIYVQDDTGKIRLINASSLVETGEIKMAYPITALALMPPQADLPELSSSSAPVAPTPCPVPSGIPQPSYSPVFTGASPTSFVIPLPIPPKISMPPRPSPGYISYGDWKIPFDVRAITPGDILLILLCFAAVLVILSGITYMMMFRKKKE